MVWQSGSIATNAVLAVAQNMAAQQAFLLEPQLFQQGVRTQVAKVGAGRQPADPHGRGVGDHGAHGLQGVALAPGVASEQEADLRPLVPAVDEVAQQLHGPRRPALEEGEPQAREAVCDAAEDQRLRERLVLRLFARREIRRPARLQIHHAVELVHHARHHRLRRGVAARDACTQVGDLVIDVRRQRAPARQRLMALVGGGDGLAVGDTGTGPLVVRLSRAMAGPIPAQAQGRLMSAPLGAKLLFLAIFVSSLPLAFSAVSFLYKFDRMIEVRGLDVPQGEMFALYVWSAGVVGVCILGSVSMAVLTAREVSRSAGRLIQAMRSVERGRLAGELLLDRPKTRRCVA